MLTKRSERQARRGSLAAAIDNQAAGGFDRRTFLRRSGLVAGSLATLGALPLGTVRKAEAEARAAATEMDHLRPLVVELREQVLPLAKRQVDQTRAAWGNGKARYDDLLRARDQWLRVETAVSNALRDYHLALVRWRAATSNH